MNGLVVVTGALGATGRETVATLLESGRRVAAVDVDAAGLAELAAATGSDRLTTHVADLTDAAAVSALVADVRAGHGSTVDGLVHLVGGWRGADGFTGNTDDDWAVLSAALVDTLRHMTLALHDDLVASEAGRAVIVSASSVAKPTAGNANYVTAKAAAETWMAALSDSFARAEGNAAAVVAVVNWIGTGKTATTPAALAAGIRDIMGSDLLHDGASLNGTRVDLTPSAAQPA